MSEAATTVVTINVGSLFERAAREQFRFDSPQGELTTEDLWGLPLSSERPGRANLDDIAKALNKKVKAMSDEESFVKPKSTDNTTPAMFDLVRYIINVKLDENEKKRVAKENAERRQKIMGIISAKQNKALEDLPLDQLQAELEKLGT
jgi:hypothetical protein